MHMRLVVREGLEHGADSSNKTAISSTGGAESGALAAQLALVAPELLVIAEAWPSLSETTKVRIMAMVKAASDEPDE